MLCSKCQYPAAELTGVAYEELPPDADRGTKVA